MQKEISTRSTKNEILDAYNDLLAKLKEQKSVDRKTEKAREEQSKIVEAASQNAPDRIVKALGETKLEIVKALDSLGERLMVEHKKLTDLQRAIEIETNNLHEMFEIKVNVDSLAALLQAQKEKKLSFDHEIEEKQTAFDAEMSQKRQQWKQEQETYELQKKERDAATKKEREREEEEYKYALAQRRKREADQYEAARAEKERTLAEREAAVAMREKELAALKAEVEAFPKKLEKAAAEAETLAVERLGSRHKHDSELSMKEIEGEKKLTKQIIETLEKRIKEQDERIRQLTQKTNEAETRVQAIAIKALEGVTAQRFPGGPAEKSGDATK